MREISLDLLRFVFVDSHVTILMVLFEGLAMAELKLETVEDFEKTAQDLFFSMGVGERYPKYWEQRTEFMIKLGALIKSSKTSTLDKHKLQKMMADIDEMYSGG